MQLTQIALLFYRNGFVRKWVVFKEYDELKVALK